jgi:ion channel-forming bestrophin family protein
VLVGTERVLNTPLPIAYSIAIGQITWAYLVILPFQLVGVLNWIAIPGTMWAAYIILGLLMIAREIENPFGRDVNDLPLEAFTQQVAAELDIIAARPKPRAREYVNNPHNRVLHPLSASTFPVWAQRGETKIREALLAKCESAFAARRAAEEQASMGTAARKSHDKATEKADEKV